MAKKASSKNAISEKRAEKAVKAPAKRGRKPGAKAAAGKASSACGGLTKVVVKFDAGWGNNLFIRGSGAGLNWQQGVLMQCVDSAEWIWENKVAKGSVDFKILVNDEVWSIGEDYSVSAGDTLTVYPEF
ncbi:MAG: hypothetical protein J6P03_00065 [Opitutales bacterium]|nr:hypothetical protein [Opitutales bacterium]